MSKEKKRKANFTSFSISLMDNNTGQLYEILPIYLKNHPCDYANQIYDLGFKLCKWMTSNKKKYTVSLDGSYIPHEENKIKMTEDEEYRNAGITKEEATK